MFYAAMLLPGNQQTPASNAVPHTSPMSSRRKTWGRGQHSSRAAAVDHVLQVVGLSKHGSTVVGSPTLNCHRMHCMLSHQASLLAEVRKWLCL